MDKARNTNGRLDPKGPQQPGTDPQKAAVREILTRLDNQVKAIRKAGIVERKADERTLIGRIAARMAT